MNKQQPKPKKIMKMVEPKVRLYPRGEVPKRKLDSAFSANKPLKKIIGSPLKIKGQSDLYSADQSDKIKKALKIK